MAPPNPAVGPYGPTQYSWIVGDLDWAWAVDWNPTDQQYDLNRRKVRLADVPNIVNHMGTAVAQLTDC
jgi:hypothetical protein